MIGGSGKGRNRSGHMLYAKHHVVVGCTKKEESKEQEEDEEGIW